MKRNVLLDFIAGFLGICILCTCATTSTKLSQPEMKPDDPRMPYDLFDKKGELSNYWLGSWEPETPVDQMSGLTVDYNVTNLSIDGFSVTRSSDIDYGYILLPPGRHSLNFSYTNSERTSSGETVSLSSPSVSLTNDFEPGKWYSFSASAYDITSQSATASYGRNLLGHGGRYSVSYSLNSSNSSLKTRLSDRSAVGPTKLRKYLEPYNASLPFESQSFLETTDGIYIVGFNDDTVNWGWSRSYSVTIGVPEGSNVLKLMKPGDKTVYTMTVNCRPGNRYVFKPDKSGIIAKNITRGDTFQVRSASKKFPTVSSGSETIVDLDALEKYLSKLSKNTTNTAYTIALDISSIDINLKKILQKADDKYVYLDFSGSTFTAIADNLFSETRTIKGITLPDSITSIGRNAFSNTYFESITIPNSVVSIGNGAFFSSGFTSITIPKSVTSIGSRSFDICRRLAAITVDTANTAYSSQDGVLYNKEKTTLIQYPAGKTSSSFTIPDSITNIGDNAFSDCNSLTSITIPKSVTSIMRWNFGGCTKLAAITVDANNTAYSSQDGVLYNKEKTTLIEYPQGKTDSSFTIPDSVIRIQDSAFYGCASLTNVTIPDSVTVIGQSAFARCKSLTGVTFATGSNITDANFGRDAFTEGSDAYGNTLKTAYATGKAGTYTRASGGKEWTRQ